MIKDVIFMCNICSSCRWKGTGTTVQGAIEEAKEYCRQERYGQAQLSYQKALNILIFYDGCKECKEAIETERNNAARLAQEYFHK